MQDGCINVLQSPIGTRGINPRQQEVARCLEAVSAASEVAGRLWSYQRRKRNDGTPDTCPHSLCQASVAMPELAIPKPMLLVNCFSSSFS